MIEEPYEPWFAVFLIGLSILGGLLLAAILSYASRARDEEEPDDD